MRKLWKGDNTMTNVLKIRCQFCDKIQNEDRFYKSRTSRRGRGGRCKSCYHKMHLEKTYGVTSEDYNKMLEKQGGTCANKACNYGLDEDHNLCVDHCHETGMVRGLLCNWCNTAEGFLKSDTEIAQGLVDYMKKHNLKTNERS